MPSIFELNLDECGRLRPTQLRNHPLYIIIYNTYGYMLLLLVIPFLLIIILNVIVVNAVREASNRRRAMRLQQIRRSGAMDRNGSQSESNVQFIPIVSGEISISRSGGASGAQGFVIMKQSITNNFNK